MSGTAEALGGWRAFAPVRWRRRDLVLFVPLALAIGYAASPFVAIMRLGYAVQTNDLPILSDAVDWARVRAALGNEIGVKPTTSPVQSTSDDLPDFGQSFATQATTNAIQTNITPTGLETMLAEQRPSSDGLLSEARTVFDNAVFIGLNRFEIRLPASRGRSAGTIRISLRFTARHGWRVERVVLPPALVDGSAT